MAREERDFVLQVFDGSNYDKWKFRLNLFLQMKDCSEAILYDERPDAISEESWKKRQVKAKNYIVNSVTNTQLELIITQDTAKQMINKLDEVYLVKSSAVKLLCKRKLLDLKMKEGENPTEFFNEFETLINQLRNSGEAVSTEDKLNYLLLTLPDNLSHIVDIVDALPEREKTVEYVKSKLQLEFQKRTSKTDSDNSKNDTQVFNTKLPKPNKVFQSHNFQRAQHKYSRGNQSNNMRFQDRRCNRCNKIGHTQNYCRENSGYNSNYSRNRNYMARTAGSSKVEENIQRNTFTVEVMSSSLNKQTESPSESNIKWLLDSGCSDHIITTDKHFYESRDLDSPTSIKVGDGFSLVSSKIGHIAVYFDIAGRKERIDIKNVFFVPQMKQNLLSVSSIVNQNNFVTFQKNTAKIYNNHRKLIAIAARNNKLFELSGRVADYKPNEINSYNSSLQMTNIQKWHRILGHVNFKDLKHLCEAQLAEGLPKQVERNFEKCEICLENKMTNLKFENNRTRANDILEIIHSDVHGPITQTGYNGEKYFVTFIDDFSKIAVVYCIKHKSEVYSRFLEYIKLMKNQTGKTIKEIRCDNGKEYLNKDFFKLAKVEGIYLKPGPAYTHELNGVAERYNRTIMNRARCLLSEGKIDKKYWPECIYTAAYIGNRLLANTKITKTPYEIFFNKRPNVSNLRLFGSVAYVRIPEERRSSKLDPKALKGILVGYTATGYKILVNDKIKISRHVQFLESTAREVNFRDSESQEDIEETNTEMENIQNQEPNEDEDRASGNTNPEQTEKAGRPKRMIKLPKRLDDHIVYVNYCNALVPETYEEAITSQDSAKWEAAMRRELHNLQENQTWSVVNTPPDKKIIEVKWIYRIKSNGEYKARVVAKGFQQMYQQGEEVYSPVARLNTLKVLLSAACVKRWKIEQMDVQAAFLNGLIKSEVYVYPPDGYKVVANKVCLLKKALYGLRESPRDWYECFDNFMVREGFIRSNYDYCMYMKKIDGFETYIILYVDDLLIFCLSKLVIDKVKLMLNSRFRMKDLGNIKQYLGIEVEQCTEKGEILLSQQKYIETLAKKYDVTQSKRFKTPMEINLKLEPAEEVEEKLKYRNLIGALLYIGSGTRPDISFAVNYLSRFQNCYDHTHFKYALRVLKYLYHTRSIKLVYRSSYTQGEEFDAYVDADWAADTVDRKSTTGILLRVFGNSILWKSQKQKIVSRASTHAEYYALADCVEEIIPIKGILSELNINVSKPITVYEDNSGAIILAQKGKFSKNSKHIDVSYHFVADYERKGLICVKKVCTEEQIADIFTKSLGRVKFEMFREALGLKFIDIK